MGFFDRFQYPLYFDLDGVPVVHPSPSAVPQRLDPQTGQWVPRPGVVELYDGGHVVKDPGEWQQLVREFSTPGAPAGVQDDSGRPMPPGFPGSTPPSPSPGPG